MIELQGEEQLRDILAGNTIPNTDRVQPEDQSDQTQVSKQVVDTLSRNNREALELESMNGCLPKVPPTHRFPNSLKGMVLTKTMSSHKPRKPQPGNQQASQVVAELPNKGLLYKRSHEPSRKQELKKALSMFVGDPSDIAAKLTQNQNQEFQSLKAMLDIYKVDAPIQIVQPTPVSPSKADQKQGLEYLDYQQTSGSRDQIGQSGQQYNQSLRYQPMPDPTTHIYDIPKFQEMMDQIMQRPVLKVNTRRVIQKEIDQFWEEQAGNAMSETSIEEGNTSTQAPTQNAVEEAEPVRLQDFAVGKKLGKGMFGEVFLVRHKPTGLIGALKKVNKQLLRVQKVQEQFVQQLKLHSFLNHPNIVQIYACFSDDDNFYVLQQLCTGGQLFDLLIKRRRISEKRTAYYVKQLVQGLRYIHTLDITHRDIKPQNILLESGMVKICDFGWAIKSIDNNHPAKVGTPLYLAPEVVKGDAYNEMVDVWGVGLIAYQLLVGNVPWNIWTQEDTQKIVEEQLTFPEYLTIKTESKEFIQQCLQKDPGKRMTLLETFTSGFLIKVNPMQYQDESNEAYGQATP